MCGELLFSVSVVKKEADEEGALKSINATSFFVNKFVKHDLLYLTASRSSVIIMLGQR